MSNKQIQLQSLSVVPFAIASLSGVVLSLFIDSSDGLLWILVFGTLLLGLLTLGTKRFYSFRSFGLLLFFVSIAWFRADSALGREERWKVFNYCAKTDSVRVTGRVVVAADESRDKSRVVLDQVLLEGADFELPLHDLRIRLFCDSAKLSALRYGDLIYAVGKLRSSSERSARFTGLLTDILSKRTVADVFVDEGSLFSHRAGGHYFRRIVDLARLWIKQVFDSALTPDAASLCKALVLGDRGDFGYRFTEELRLTGLTHIFALSGLNTGLIISLLWFALGFLFVPRNLRYLLLLIAALFYMELGREVPSLVRATLMCSAFLAGQLLQKRTLVINYLAIAMLIELLWRPMDIVDPGFALSYLSVLGMIAGYSMLRQTVVKLTDVSKSGILKSSTDVFIGTLTAQAGTLPLTGFLFHRIPMIGGLGNLIVVPGFALMLVLASLVLFLAVVAPILVQFISPAIEWLSFMLGWIVHLFAELPLSGLQIPDASFLFLIFVYALLFSVPLLWLLQRQRAAVFTLLLLACTVVWTGALHESKTSRLTFIDVGNGDACLIETGDHRLMVDAGPRYGEWSAAHIILPYLSDRGIAHLDGLILTHPDNDHIGGAAELLQRVKVDNLWVNGDSSSSRTFVDLQVSAKAQGLQLKTLQAGDVVRLSESVSLTILTPDSLSLRRLETSNQKSLAMILRMDSSSAFLAGDIDSTVERELLCWSKLIDVDLLHAGHHGSKSSSSLSFLRAATPDLCVLTAGRRNIYGHPAPEVMERLSSLDISCLVTGSESTLVFEPDKAGWKRVKPKAQLLAELWNLPYG